MDPLETRDLAPGMGLSNALTIVAVFTVLGAVLAWLFAPTVASAIDAMTAPPPACAVLDLSAAECGALMEDAR